ncbi:MAG: glycolate oxidase subunit GlcF [Nitrosomonadales bacterium]|nr:glycolate oxidase subunit GlcF [Nitrosomonadales bacterium]
MQTSISPQLLNNPDIAEADSILRSCVHCGFCNATCPTYQLLGSELDGPRGRIYLIKEMLETGQATDKTRLHLDRCLTCRSCETTCPSGVRYGRLIDIGREMVKKKAPRSFSEKLVRGAMLAVLPHTARISVALKLARAFRPLLPSKLQEKIPAWRPAVTMSATSHARRMLVLEGCIQPLSSPNTNAAAARVLDRFGISLLAAQGAGCCGALNQHLSDPDGAHEMMRRNIDAWWPHVESGIEAIVMTASGCGLMVKDYGTALKDDTRYANRAARISELTRDLSEVISDEIQGREDLGGIAHIGHGMRVACQSSCTLQHGQKLGGKVEAILKRCGYELTTVADSHLCCGAAGTYTLLQPELSQQLLNNKLAALHDGKPEVIVTANIGCQMHLATASTVRVKHWIELLEQK